jgi:uncharacterized protein involved in outer membrane biogenesis
MLNSLLLSLASIVIIIFSLAFGGPYFIEWGDYRQTFEAYLSEQLGRKISLAGDIDVRLLPVPFIKFEDISVSNSEPGKEEVVLEAEELTVLLSLPPLLKNTLEAEHIEITRPHMRLAINNKGKTGWQWRLGKAPDTSYLPSRILLDAVTIVDGQISLVQTGATDAITTVVGSIDHIHGVLSAPSLEGPYKFSGSIGDGHNLNKLRFSTSRLNKGGLRLKGVMRGLTNKNRYAADLRLENIAGDITLSGDVNARITPYYAATDEDTSDQSSPLVIDASLTASSNKASFESIKLSLRHNSRVQNITGEALLNWDNKVSMDVVLNSKWFDFDILRPSLESGKLLPHAVLQNAVGMVREVDFVDSGTLVVNFEQAAFAGDILKDLHLSLAKSATGKWVEVNRASATMPAGNKVSFQGVVGASSYAGPFNASGNSLSHLIRWLSGGHVETGKKRLKFSLSGNLKASEEVISLNGVRGTVDDNAFSGKFSLIGHNRKKIELDIKSPYMEVPRLLGRDIGVRDVFEYVAGTTGKGDIRTDISLDVERMRLSDIMAEDVEVDVSIGAGDKIDVRKLAVKSTEGLAINITARDKAGRYAALLDVQNSKAAMLLAKMTGTDLDWIPPESVKAMLPVHISADISRTDQVRVEVLGNGTLGDSELSFVSRFPEGVDNFPSQQMSVTASLQNLHAGRLLQQLFPAINLGSISQNMEGRGRLAVDMSGAPKEALNGNVVLQVPGMRSGINGLFAKIGTKQRFDGDMDISAKDLALLLAITGLQTGPYAKGQTVRLTGKISKNGDVYNFSGLKGSIENSAFNASGRIDLSSEKPKIDLSAKLEKASIPAISSMLIAWSEGEIDIGEISPKPLWSMHTFAKDMPSLSEIRLDIAAERLRLAGNIEALNSSLFINTAESSLNIDLKSGSLFGGELKANAKLTTVDMGMYLSGRFDLHQARLGQAIPSKTETATQPASGEFTVGASFSGAGMTMHSIMSRLTGKGEIKLAGGQMRRLAPSALRQMTVSEETVTTDLADELAAKLQQGSFAYKALQLPILLNDGLLEARDIHFVEKDGDGMVQAEAYLELPRLLLDSRWKILATNDNSIAPVIVSHSGSILDMDEARHEVDSKTFVQNLKVARTVRAIEKIEATNQYLPQPEVPAGAGIMPTLENIQPSVSVSPKPENDNTPPPAAPSPYLMQ